MIVGIPRETCPGERRVALTPDAVPLLLRLGVQVQIQSQAGRDAGFPDEEYAARGAVLAPSREALFADADLIAQVRTAAASPAGESDLPLLRRGQTVVGLADPLGENPRLARLVERGVQLFALELIPRITRAQSMDVLSSQSLVAGYRAALLAASASPRLFPMYITAAGTIAPARVFVIGAGVAGLQAIATARRLGAVVEAYDVRPAVRQEVESLGARFLDMSLDTSAAEGAGGYARAMDEDFYKAQRERMAPAIAAAHVVITTAAVPGRRAPLLVTADMVRAMPPGSVIVDLAAERGGNCELTRPDEIVVEGAVTILGPTNLPASAPFHASQMFARNLAAFLKLILRDRTVSPDLNDPIVRETLVARDGHLVHPRLRARPAPASGSTAS